MHKNRVTPPYHEERVVFHKDDLPWVRDRIQEGQVFATKQIEAEEHMQNKKGKIKAVQSPGEIYIPRKLRGRMRTAPELHYFDLYKMMCGVV